MLIPFKFGDPKDDVDAHELIWFEYKQKEQQKWNEHQFNVIIKMSNWINPMNHLYHNCNDNQMNKGNHKSSL